MQLGELRLKRGRRLSKGCDKAIDGGVEVSVSRLSTDSRRSLARQAAVGRLGRAAL